ncbi:lytic transglycosylase domain-containing protein [Phenylobacterium sp.]|jgi:soluble lytic murein transglycosylase-like protein|uniref:lytic transglycosylase domain-containing protein n=1 Tax=Phenylobacterium sp. TaxID=1871053 RepID=UPI0037830E59
MRLIQRLRVGISAFACVAVMATAAAADGLQPLSADDARVYALAFEAADRGDFIDAHMKTLEVKDTSLVGYVSFRQLMHPSQHKASFDELSGWLGRFGDLPLAERIFSLAAKRKPAQAPALAAPQITVADLVRAPLPALDRGWLARDAYYSGDAKRALELAPDAGERWIAGLSAWKLGQLALAESYFAAVAHDYAEDVWQRSAAGYWAARTANSLGDPTRANNYLKLAAQQPNTFYGMLADRQLQFISQTADAGTVIRASYSAPVARPVAPPPAAAPKPPSPEIVQFAEHEPRARRAAALLQLGRTDEARQELRAGMALAVGPSSQKTWKELVVALASLAPEKAPPRKRASLAPAEYPAPALEPTSGFTVDKALVYAIAYQESRFNPAALSPVGAIGLMQLMPETAALTTGNARLKRDFSPLYDPAFNMKVGQEYIAWLRERGVGHDILRTVAAYNGGPGAVLKTLARVGEDADPLLVIESLPAQETRDYVEKVMAAYWSYKRMWGQETKTLDALAGGARIIDARLDIPQPVSAPAELTASLD